MASSAQARTSQPPLTYRLRRTIKRARPMGYVFLLPAFVFYASFRLVPYVQTFWYGLHDWDGASPPTWIGTANYAEALSDQYFWWAGWNTLKFMAINMTVPLGGGLLLALLVAEVSRGRTFFRVALFTPYVLSAAVVAVMWRQIFSPQVGVINLTLKGIGLESLAHSWLGESAYALWAVGVSNAWHGYGFSFVIFLAGLQTIDTALYEAAKLDGANWFQLVRFVTLPGLSNAITMLLSMAIMGTIAFFTYVFIMTDGGPNFSSEVLATYIYDKAFDDMRFGYASALSVGLALLVLVVTATFIRFRERGD